MMTLYHIIYTQTKDSKTLRVCRADHDVKDAFGLDDDFDRIEAEAAGEGGTVEYRPVYASSPSEAWDKCR